MSKDIQVANSDSVFSNIKNFEDAQRMAKVLVSSKLVPLTFQGADKMQDAMIAMEMAQRMNATPIAVMQNLYIVHGRPSWSASFIAAAIASSKRFSPIRYKMTGIEEKDDRTCVCLATDYTGEIIYGPPVSIGMARKEGWYGKKGSKWPTMSELMLRYRAVTLFGRLYAPDILMGMHTQDEIHDIGAEIADVYDESNIDVDLNCEPENVTQSIEWSSFVSKKTKIEIKMHSGRKWSGVFIGVNGDEVAIQTKDGGFTSFQLSEIASVELIIEEEISN